MEENIIKSITTLSCPHCKGDVYIESQMTPPVISSMFTEKELADAKLDCLARIETLTISDEKKDQVIKWINNIDTIFSPNEVENIILSLLNPEQ